MSANNQVHPVRGVKSNGNRCSEDEKSEGPYEFGEYGYGKNSVKLLHVRRDGTFHTIREYEVSTHLKLLSKKDFTTGDNKDIIATDTQKNIVYILAKKYGVSPSKHLTACDNFVPHITRVGLQHHRQVGENWS
jgi:urate oxidase